jgi:hypothetical protein
MLGIAYVFVEELPLALVQEGGSTTTSKRSRAVDARHAVNLLAECIDLKAVIMRACNERNKLCRRQGLYQALRLRKAMVSVGCIVIRRFLFPNSSE